MHQAPAGSLARAVDMVTPQSLAAVAQLRDLGLDELLGEVDRPELMVVLVAVNDPGNAGTLLRSAEAAGAGAVVFCDDSVDPYNPKCVRASAGSLFRLPVVRAADAAETLAALRGRGIRCVGTVTQDAAPYDLVDWTGPAAVVLGNEAHGLPPAVEPELDEMVTIPMRRSVESLNVAMAGTLVCFEAARQRRAGGGRADSSNNSRNRLDDASSSAAGFSAA